MLIYSCLIILSCSVNKNINLLFENESIILKRGDLTNEERNIMNDFLNLELKKEKYKNYRDYPICILNEGSNRPSPLIIYKYCYDERNLKIRSSTNKDWILDEYQINNIKDTINKNKYIWRKTDFKNLNVSFVNYNELNDAINKNNYLKYSKKLIIKLSIPLIINKNNALIAFSSKDGWFGYSTIDRFVTLLKKNKDGNWEIDSYYYDPNSSW